MKRFRFSLRLLLLVVMLCATIFAWRHAIAKLERLNEIRDLESRIATQQWELDQCRGEDHDIATRIIANALRGHIEDSKARLQLLKNR